MKKLLLVSGLIGLALTSIAQAPTYQWSYLLDSQAAQDNITSVLVASDGKLISIGQFGSKVSTDKFSYNGEEIATGAATSSTSENYNLMVIKHNADGTKQWAVSSASGYVPGASATAVAATSDGGLVMILKPRATQLDPDYLSPVLVEADGTEVTLENWNTSAWIYNALIVKIASDGSIDWTRTILQDQTPIGTKATTDAVTPYALVVDKDGNIYIGGNYRSPMVFAGEKNSCYVLTPRNLEGYTGDSQKAAGGMFLVKLNGEGEYLAHMSSDGALTRDQIAAMCYADGKIYFAGNVQGSEESVLTIGEKSITMPNARDNLMIGCCDENLAMDYLTVYGNTGTLQLKRLQMIGGALYAVGAINGSIIAPGSSEASLSSAETKLEGFALKINPADGTLSDRAMYGGGISSWLYAFKAGDQIWLYGYNMVNAAKGLNASAATLTAWTPTRAESERYNLVTGGGVPTVFDGAYDEKSETFYAPVRGNNVFKFLNSEAESEKPINWGSVLTAFSMKDNQSAVNEAMATGFSVEGGEGKILITSPDTREITIYDAAATLIFKGEVNVGMTEIAAPAGICIVGSEKVMVR